MCGAAQSDHPSTVEVSLFQQALAERLHDGPLQELVALQLRAANLARLSGESGADREARIVDLGSLAQTAIDHLQQIIRDLTGDASRPVAFFARLTELCDQFRAGSGIECRLLAVPAHVCFEPAVSEVVFRALRELLTNVRKHSQATLVKITSRVRQDGFIAISVCDNGIGLKSVTRRRTPFEGGGFGLWSIEHRLGEFGGTLEIDNDPGLRATIAVPHKLLVAE